MSTPALDRAYGAADRAMTTATPPPGVDLSAWLSGHGERALIHGAAHAAVSAALHDPDDPDWLARGLYDEMRKGTITPPWEEAHPTTQESFRYQARCFVAAILGEAS